MPWAAAATVAGTAIMGAVAGGSGGKTQEQQSTTAPWEAQAPYLTNGFQNAQDIYNSKKGSPAYGGELYAGLNPQQIAALQSLNGYASGRGQTLADLMSSTGTGAMGLIPQAGANAGALFQRAGTDPTQSNIGAATAYANNPAMDGMVDAASRDVVRNLQENQLPANAMKAAASGNVNSSRSAMTDAILTRGTQDRVADISSTLRGNAYNNGLNLAENARTANLGAGLTANGQMAGLGQYGGQLAQTGYSTTMNNLNIPLQTGGVLQQDQQGQDSAGLTQFQMNDQRPWDLLNNYWNIVGGRNWGGSTEGSTSNPGGVMNGIMGAAGGAALGGGLYRTFSPGIGGGGAGVPKTTP
jgi:hypothetical protein